VETGFDSATARFHLLSFLADFALGVRMLLSAAFHHCAYEGGSKCSVHVVLGSLITAASFMDFAFAMTFLHSPARVYLQLDVVTRKVRL
jgi:hypothetical protein